MSELTELESIVCTYLLVCRNDEVRDIQQTTDSLDKAAALTKNLLINNVLVVTLNDEHRNFMIAFVRYCVSQLNWVAICTRLWSEMGL